MLEPPDRRFLQELARSARTDHSRYVLSSAAWGLLGRIAFLSPLIAVVATAAVLWYVDTPEHAYAAFGAGVFVANLYGLEWYRFVAERRRRASGGARLTREQAPALFEEISRISAEFRGKRPDGVILDEGFSAGLQYEPRRRLPWLETAFLKISLPLLENLGLEAGRFVLAHVLACNARSHPLERWVGGTLERLEFESKSAGRLMLPRRFWDWYLAQLQARVSVLLRLREEDADRVAAGIAGVRSAAEALTVLYAKGQRLELDGRPAAVRRAFSSDEGTPELSRALAEFVRMPRPSDARDLSEALGVIDSEPASFPPLKYRLDALGVDSNAVSVPAPPGVSAAEAWWGERLPHIRRLVDDGWKSGMDDWASARSVFRDKSERLDALRARSDAPGSLLEGFEELRLAAEIEGLASAAVAAERLASAFPEAPLARLNLGLMLARGSDERCLEHLRYVIERGSILSDRAYEGMILFAEHTRRTDSLSKWKDELDEARRNLAAAMTERSAIFGSHEYSPHSLRSEEVRALAYLMEGAPGVRGAWLARREVQGYSNSPHYVLLIERSGLIMPHIAEAWKQWLTTITPLLAFDDGTCQVAVDEGGYGIAAKIREIPDAAVHRRSSGQADRYEDALKTAGRWAMIAVCAAMMALFTYEMIDSRRFGLGLPAVCFGMIVFNGLFVVYLFDPSKLGWALPASIAAFGVTVIGLGWVTSPRHLALTLSVGVPCLLFALSRLRPRKRSKADPPH